MNHVLFNLFTIITINGAILIIPGANFFLIVRNAASEGRRSALVCAFGITTAIMFHVVVSYLFLGYILEKYYMAFQFIKYIGSMYLLYLGCKMFFNKKLNSTTSPSDGHHLKSKNAFIEGVLVDLFNPFVLLFYVSFMSEIVKPNTPTLEIILYFGVIFSLTIGWFLLVATLFSVAKIRNHLLSQSLLLHKFAGSAFFWFSYKLATSQIG